MTTLLGLIQQASYEMALQAPTTIIGNPSQDIIQLLGLTNGLGGDLTRSFPWQDLSKEYRFTTSFSSTTGNITGGSPVVTNIPSTTGLDSTYMVTGVGINQDTYILTVDSATQVTLTQNCTVTANETLTFSKVKYALPSDWDRQQNRTHFDKSKHWEMLGPETPQQWQWLKSAYISTGPRIRYRIMGNYFQIWPPIGTNEYLGYEYISTNWVTPASGTSPSQTAFQADTDTCIYPDRLMICGLKLKYFQVKGFETSAFLRDYEEQLDISKANDMGASTLSFSPRVSSVLIGWENIPDSGYGS